MMRSTSKGQSDTPGKVGEHAAPIPKPGPSARGQALVEGLQGLGDFGLSTDEVIALMRGLPADEG